MCTPWYCRQSLARACGLFLIASISLVQAQTAVLLDHRTPAYLAFSSPVFTVFESQTNAVITINRTGEFREPVSVDYATSDGTANEGQDYAGIAGTLTIPAGVGFASLTIPITNDGLAEGSETVLLSLSNPSANAMITRGSATLTIADAPASSAPILRVRPNGAGQLIISWSGANASACVLQKTTDASIGGWADVDAPLTSGSGTCAVLEPASGPRHFYRLKMAVPAAP